MHRLLAVDWGEPRDTCCRWIKRVPHASRLPKDGISDHTNQAFSAPPVNVSFTLLAAGFSLRESPCPRSSVDPAHLICAKKTAPLPLSGDGSMEVLGQMRGAHRLGRSMHCRRRPIAQERIVSCNRRCYRGMLPAKP